MWQTSKASLLADRQLQLRLRTHWRSLSANSFPESTTESKVKPNQCSNVATQSCNHHHCQDKHLQPEWIVQLTLRSLLFPDEFVLSTLGILCLFQMLPLWPWFALDGAVNGTPWRRTNLSDYLFNAMRILQISTSEWPSFHALLQPFPDWNLWHKRTQTRHPCQNDYPESPKLVNLLTTNFT
jgi:hypothetical protein